MEALIWGQINKNENAKFLLIPKKTMNSEDTRLCSGVYVCVLKKSSYFDKVNNIVLCVKKVKYTLHKDDKHKRI